MTELISFHNHLDLCNAETLWLVANNNCNWLKLYDFPCNISFLYTKCYECLTNFNLCKPISSESAGAFLYRIFLAELETEDVITILMAINISNA